MSGPHLRNATGKIPLSRFVQDEDEGMMERILIMLLIFTVSLFAVSFPTITATFRSIRVPSILFFVGKHFGTGVILSTAFVHLLQDAFKALLKPIVNEKWRKVGDWAGMIVLASLLCIFLIEYVSTAYVDRLQSYPSLPSTPTASGASSSAASVQMEYDSDVGVRPSILVQSPHGTNHWTEDVPRPRVSEHRHHENPSEGPLQSSEAAAQPVQSSDAPQCPGSIPSSDETTPLNQSSPDVTLSSGSGTYGATSQRSSTIRPPARPSNRLAHISAPPGDAFFSGGHHRHESRDVHSHHHARVSRWRWLGFLGFGGSTEVSTLVAVDHPHTPSRTHSHSHSHSHVHGHSSSHSQGEPVTPKAHIVESSSSGNTQKHGENGQEHGQGGSKHHGHAHMDMERWMHDIDGEPANSHGHAHGHMHDGSVDEECAADTGDNTTTKVGRRRQVIGILVLQLGIMIHSLVIGLTLSITTGSEFTSLVIAIVFHQLFEGLSLGIRIAGLPTSDSEHGFHYLPGNTLKPLLAITFATTTPLGIGIGLAALGAGKSKGPHLILVQGVMSAISAGMLIYAACVEMLAGDFVMDAHLWRSSVQRQALALVSLLAGVGAMAAIGILD